MPLATPTPSLPDVATPLDLAGAVLEQPLYVTPVLIGPRWSCADIADAGWQPTCGQATLAGDQVVVWLAEHRQQAGDPEPIWKVRLIVHDPHADRWIVALQNGYDNQAAESVTVRDIRIPGSDAPLLLVAFRQGAGDDRALSYDAVAGQRDGLPYVAGGARSIERGSLVLDGGRLREYAADCPEGPATCAPDRTVVRELTFAIDGRLHIASFTTEPGAPPPGDVP
jgi:hypothetical protein